MGVRENKGMPYSAVLGLTLGTELRDHWHKRPDGVSEFEPRSAVYTPPTIVSLLPTT